MKIPEKLIQQIRQQVNIVDVISDYVVLEKRGRNYFGCCPFHEEDTPSFSVSEEKQIFYCFGCHESGNVYSFLMKHVGLSFKEAVFKIADYVDVDISAYQAEREVSEHPHTSYYAINQFVAEFYAYMLQTEKGKQARQYLQHRGIAAAEIERFMIGYAPDEHLLAKLLAEKGYDVAQARELGILSESYTMIEDYDTFRGRIIFPILDDRGQVVAFTGRKLASEQNEKAPKYLHSPESKIFHKREILYHFYQAHTMAKRSKKLYICEGIFDVIAVTRAGFENVCATLGTAFTKEQLQLVQRQKLDISFVYDNDNAGKSALIKGLLLSLEAKQKAYAITFWEYAEKDLDEIITKFSASQVRSIMEKELSAIDYFMQYYRSTLNLENNEDRQEYTKKIIEALAYTDELTQAFYYEQLQQQTGYSMKLLRRFESSPLPEQNNVYGEPLKQHKQHSLPTQEYSKQEKCEHLIVNAIVLEESMLLLYQKQQVLSQNAIFRKVVYDIMEYYRTHQYIDVSDLLTTLDPEGGRFLSESIHMEEPVNEALFLELLRTLKELSEHRFYREEALKIDNHVDEKLQADKLQQYLDFKKKINRVRGE